MEMTVGTQYVAQIAGSKQEQLNQFGKLMGTAGRIHTDPQWAATTPAGGVLVQGGLVMAPLHDVMCQLVGADRWLRGSTIKMKIVSFTRINEPIAMSVKVEEVNDEWIRFGVNWVKEGGTTVLVAEVKTQR